MLSFDCVMRIQFEKIIYQNKNVISPHNTFRYKLETNQIHSIHSTDGTSSVNTVIYFL